MRPATATLLARRPLASISAQSPVSMPSWQLFSGSSKAVVADLARAAPTPNMVSMAAPPPTASAPPIVRPRQGLAGGGGAGLGIGGERPEAVPPGRRPACCLGRGLRQSPVDQLRRHRAGRAALAPGELLEGLQDGFVYVQGGTHGSSMHQMR